MENKTQQNGHIAHARTHEEEAGNRVKLSEFAFAIRTHARENKRTQEEHREQSKT